MARPEPTDTARETPWVRQPERSNLATLRLMTWISLTFGRPVGRLVLLGISAYFVAFAPKARRASRDYLRRALAAAREVSAADFSAQGLQGKALGDAIASERVRRLEALRRTL